jgi:hypothetical protein
MKAVVNFAIVINEIMESIENVIVFYGQYSFEMFISLKVQFKCDFELVLYHDVYLNKLNFACAVVCSC